MTPTVVGVGILQVLACGEGGIPIRPAPSCERIGGPMPTQSKTASSTSQDFPKAQSRSSGLFRRDLQPQNGHFDVPRFPTSPIAPQACFAAICGQKRPLRRSEISHKPNRVPQACFAAICSHKTATSTFRDFQKAMPRSSGLFRRVLRPKTASSTFRDFPQAQSRSSGLFRRDLQPQNGHFDVPRFPGSQQTSERHLRSLFRRRTASCSAS